MMKYKGYLGLATLDPDARVFRGSVINIMDTITFQGQSVDELEREFRASVDDYLEFCESRGEKPDKVFSGRLPLRVTPETHRSLAIEAKANGLSLNAYTAKLLERMTRRTAKAGGSRLVSD